MARSIHSFILKADVARPTNIYSCAALTRSAEQQMIMAPSKAFYNQLKPATGTRLMTYWQLGVDLASFRSLYPTVLTNC